MPLVRSWSICGARCAGRLSSRTIWSRSRSRASATALSTSRSTSAGGVTGRTMTRRWRRSCCSCVSVPGPALCASTTAGSRTPATTTTALRVLLIGRLLALNLPPYRDASARTVGAQTVHVMCRRPRVMLTPEAHVVRQLVDVARPAREEARQRRAHLADGADERVARRARAQTLHHPVADACPVIIADSCVDALVADDRKLAILDGQVDEHAAAVGRAMHTERGKDLARARHRVGGAPAQAVRDAPLGVHANLRGRCALGGAHGRRDRVQIRLREDAARPARMAAEHHQSPLAPPPPKLPPPPEKPPPPPPHEPPPQAPPPPLQKIGGCELHPRR